MQFKETKLKLVQFVLCIVSLFLFVLQTNASQKKIQTDVYHIVVAQDGAGDFTSIQEAIDNAKSFPYKRIIIEIKKGIYNEKVHIPAWNTKISLVGENRDSTIIRYNDYFAKINRGRNSTFYTATLQVDGDDFYATNLTIENTSGAKKGQAIALAINANRVYLENCNIKGFQDTLYIAGEGNKQYFENCYIEGTTDFIFGGATAYFEKCVLHSKSNSFITAASTPKDIPYGFVFDNCTLSADSGIDEVYLGRPWRTYAKTVFIHCLMGKHIAPEGWDNWSNADAEKYSYYGEYNCTEAGSIPARRVAWAHSLTDDEAEFYSKEKVLGQNFMKLIKAEIKTISDE